MILTKRYGRENAVTYAKTWALSENPLFASFRELGGDCTNFVSQCLLAGSCIMDKSEPFGWFYETIEHRSASWAGVGYLYSFLVGGDGYPPTDRREGPFGREVPMRHAQIGDIIQLSRGGVFYHSLLITGFEKNDILVSAHSVDSLDRRLSTYTFEGLRFLHIDGVRVGFYDEDCFKALNEGISLPL